MTEPYTELFTSLLKWSDDRQALMVRENFFTAALAGVLQEDPYFARDFVKLLCAGRAQFGPHQIARAKILFEPRTRRFAKGESEDLASYPDLTLTVTSAAGSARVIHIEVKLGAPEGRKEGQPHQVAKYLQLGRDHVAYVRGFPQVMSPTVLRNPRYLRPESRRQHFLWSDVYPLVEDGIHRVRTGALHRGLLGLMKAQGFAPLHPLLPQLGGPESSRVRLAYRDLLSEMQRDLATLPHWTCLSRKSNGTMWAYSDDFKLEFNPVRVPGTFRIWISEIYRPKAWAIQRSILEKLPDRLEKRWPGIAAQDPVTGRPAVNLSIPYKSLLRGARSTAKVGDLFARYSMNVIAELEDIANSVRSTAQG